jgi:hypothetical protein
MITTHARLRHIRKSYKKISVGKTPPAGMADRTQSPCGRNGRPSHLIGLETGGVSGLEWQQIALEGGRPHCLGSGKGV